MDLYIWPYQFYNKTELSRKCDIAFMLVLCQQNKKVLFILPTYKQSTSFHTGFFQPPKKTFSFGLTNIL